MYGRQAYKGPDSDQDWSKFVLKMSVHGYAYQINSMIDIAAVIMLLFYSACAIAHLGWMISWVRMSSRVVFRGRSNRLGHELQTYHDDSKHLRRSSFDCQLQRADPHFRKRW